MLQVKEVSKSFGSQEILTDVSFTLEREQKAALVGGNGTGKSTLLKIIAGRLESDKGQIELAQNSKLGYLPQVPELSIKRKTSVKHYLEDTIGQKIDDSLVENYQNERSIRHRLEVMMSGFELSDISLYSDFNNLSGGQKNKITLIATLLTDPDLLLLDEPTNNLDLPALIWLEGFLKQTKSACLIVSHDRVFLDQVTSRVLEIDRDSKLLNVNSGSYTDYLERKKKERARQMEEYNRQQEEINRLKKRAKEKKIDAKKGSKWQGSDQDKYVRGFKRDRAIKSDKTAKALETRIKQMEEIEKPVIAKSLTIPLTFKKRPEGQDIDLKKVSFNYPEGFQLGPLDLLVSFGDRVSLLGSNGSGKSTLLKIITGQLTPDTGSVSIGSKLIFGYLIQEHSALPVDQSSIEYIQNQTGLSRTEAYTTLRQFGLKEKEVISPIDKLSPGCKTRMLLAVFTAKSVNTLVLDEPSNHLDLEALTALEEVLSDYQGTVLLVSHDRHLLEQTGVNRVYQLTNGQIDRLDNLETYLDVAEKKARKLLKVIN